MKRLLALMSWMQRFTRLAIALGVVMAAAHYASAAEVSDNLALGKPYKLHPLPTYKHCTDANDRIQLTDGRTTTSYFWTQQGTVGWQRVGYATVTVDLGRIEPIGGAAITTAAGCAGVTWPLAIHVLTSDDGHTFRDAGELVALNHKQQGPWPSEYAIRKISTNELRARGRYVQFVLIPKPGGPFLFTDEVEIYRGPEEVLKLPASGPVVAADEVYRNGRISRSLQLRFRSDAEAIAQKIRAAEGLPPTQTQQLLNHLNEATAQYSVPQEAAKDTFRAVLPIGEEHARCFAVQAELWQALGRPTLVASVPCAWDPIELTSLPPETTSGEIEVHTMQNEYRAAAVNLYDSSAAPRQIHCHFEGLPGGPTPAYITLHQVQWTDTGQGQPVAAALPEATRTDSGWQLTVQPGLVRQAWMTFHVEGLEAGGYAGQFVMTPENGPTLRVPVQLRVWPLIFPSQTTLLVGGWSYTNGSGSYGMTPQNREAFLRHLQEHFVNAPWATSSVMRSVKFDPQDPAQIQLDTQTFDAWIAEWPNAKRYMVFLSVGDYSGTSRSSLVGAQVGTPEFEHRVGVWISAWVRHLRSKGITPDRLGLLIHDEPHEGSDVRALLAWARAIRRAEPEVLVWEDPTYRNPAAAPAALFEASDVLCPNRPMWLAQGEAFGRFFRDQQAAGRELQFYSCSGPAKLLDPYSYYRLQAWHAWHIGATGSFFWAFGDNSGASSWNEYLAKSGPYTPLFLDATTVVAGKQMEAIRESVEDFEYLVMLRKAVDRAKQQDRNDEDVKKADLLLTDGVKTLLAAEGASQMRWHEPKDRKTADQLRVEIIETLTKLH